MSGQDKKPESTLQPAPQKKPSSIQALGQIVMEALDKDWQEAMKKADEEGSETE